MDKFERRYKILYVCKYICIWTFIINSSLRFCLRSPSSFNTEPAPHYNPTSPPLTHFSQLLFQLLNHYCHASSILSQERMRIRSYSQLLLKDCASVLVPIITKIINLCLYTVHFRTTFKHSLVTSLL